MFNRRFAILAIFSFTLGLFTVACGGKAEDKLVGKWGINLEATMAADPKMKEMPEDAKKKAMEQAKAFLGNMSFEFTKDGQAIAKMGDKEEKSTYKVTKTEGNTLTIEMTEGEGDKAKKETMTFTIDGDSLTMKQGNQTLVLKKM